MGHDAASDIGTGRRQILGADPAMRRAWLAHNTGHVLEAVADTAFAPEETRGRIENLVGAAQVPLGIGGPIRVNGQHADGLFYVPFATTEGTLVTTYQYGMRAITEAGGAHARVVADGLDITPCFVVATTRDAIALAEWLNDHLPELEAVAGETTAHGRLAPTSGPPRHLPAPAAARRACGSLRRSSRPRASPRRGRIRARARR